MFVHFPFVCEFHFNALSVRAGSLFYPVCTERIWRLGQFMGNDNWDWNSWYKSKLSLTVKVQNVAVNCYVVSVIPAQHYLLPYFIERIRSPWLRGLRHLTESQDLRLRVQYPARQAISQLWIEKKSTRQSGK